MKRALLCLVLSVSLLGMANAAPSKLKGKYAFTGTESGILATGFTANFVATGSDPDPFGFFRNLQGIATFNGDGTGTVEGKSVGNTEPEGGASGWSENFSYDFTYTVDKDGNITMNLADDSYTGTFTQGTLAVPDNSYTLNSLALSGMASKKNRVLTLGTASLEVVTVNYQIPDKMPPDYTRYKISQYSLVFTWLGKK